MVLFLNLGKKSHKHPPFCCQGGQKAQTGYKSALSCPLGTIDSSCKNEPFDPLYSLPSRVIIYIEGKGSQEKLRQQPFSPRLKDEPKDLLKTSSTSDIISLEGKKRQAVDSSPKVPKRKMRQKTYCKH